jgi:short-subunit dehydrogenase
VLGIDRGFISKAWWMPAEDVVAASLEGLEKGKLFVVPGWRYKLLVSVMRMLPRGSLHFILTKGPASLRSDRRRR